MKSVRNNDLSRRAAGLRAASALTMILRGIAATALALSVWASSAEGWFTAVALVLGGYGLLYALFSFIGSRSWLDLGLALLAAWNLLRLAL